MLPSFVIGLREGLEAALIVGIIAAFLVTRGKGLRPMWLGVALAVGLCATLAVTFAVVGSQLSLKARETMEGVLSLVAVAGVTYMIVWMRRHARSASSAKNSGKSSCWRSVIRNTCRCSGNVVG